MKKSKFLSVLVLGALMGAMTLSTTNSANADTNITINGTGTGGSNTWTSATADADGLEASGGGNSETYDYWVHRGGSSGDTLTMTGGSLIINSLPNGHDWIKASGGDITVNNGPLNINSDSNIQSAVNLVVNGTGTVNVTGGSVVINNGDTVSGKINATAGTITFGDTRTLDSSNYTVSGTVATVIDGNITSNISLAGSGGITVNSGSGKQLTINANNVDAALTNNGKVILNGGTLGNTISGAGATEITGNVINNSTITQSTGGIQISSGSLTTNAGNVTGTITNNVVDGYILNGGTNDNTITGSEGRTMVDAGTNTVTNTGNIQQALRVKTGTFDNTTGSVTGLTTIESNATAKQSGGGSLGAVSNEGTFEVSNGTVTSITNSATGTQGVSQSGGTVTSVNNTGTYNLTGGTITNFSQSTGDLNISKGASLTISNGTNPLTSAVNAITGGNVLLGGTDDTAGTLIINNGLATNQAKVTNAGTGASVLTVQGNSTLDLINNSEITSAVALTVANGSTLDISSTKANTDGIVIDGDDTWAGTVDLTGGTLTILGNNAKTGILDADTGNLNIGSTLGAGTLNLNNTNDSIASAVTVNIASNSTLNQSAGNAILGSDDTWNGAISLSGTGDLTLDGRADVTDATKTFNQSAGKLTIRNGGSLTLNTSDSKIDGTSEVVLGTAGATPADATAGTLVINNGLTTNQAKITTAGTGANALTVKGSNTYLFLKGTSDIESGTVTVGDATDKTENFLYMDDSSIIGKTANVVINENAAIGMYGNEASGLTINSGDTWNGFIYQDGDTNSTLTILNDNYTKDTGYLHSDGGNIIIGHIGNPESPAEDPDIAGTLKLNNVNDYIAQETKVTINTNGTLQQSDGAVELDNATDIWNGAIELSDNGALRLSDFSKATNGNVRYNQNGGLAVFDGTNLLLLPNDDESLQSVISDGIIELTNSSTLSIANGVDNAAAISMEDENETLNVIANSTLTLGNYTYDLGGNDEELVQTKIGAGTVRVGTGLTEDNSVLEVSSGTIAKDADVVIAKGAALNITGATAAEETAEGAGDAIVANVTLDGNDTWDGDINLSNDGNSDDTNVSLTLDGVTQTTGAVATALGGESPYYSQTGGSLYMTNGTTLSMADSSLISGGNLTVDTSSTYNSLSNAFSVNNLTNAGLINGINGGYENYAVSTGFYAGDSLGDKQGDFNVDLYARCNDNNDYKYDSFGSDSATIYASDASKHGILNVSDWNLNGDLYGWDAPLDRSYDITKLFKGSVAEGHTIDFTTTNKEVFTPIGWYGLHSTGNGNYSFKLNRFNPGVYRGQVTKIAQYQNQLMIDDILFSHTMLDQGFKGNDYIASNPNRVAAAGDIFPPYQYSRKDGGLWVKMYGTFEKLNMNHGLNVGNNAYGTIIGADLGLKELRNGWQFMPTAYISYNGAHQYWRGYGAYQNGGQLGLMGTWYKDNFIIGALAYGGVYNNDMDTPRGSDDSLGYFGGGAVKTAYNWRFARDWSLQPNFLVAYNFFGKENWHSDFGQMGMMSGMLHGVNIAPGVNLIWEKETFSIYGTLQYMYNVNQSVGGRAGHVGLPQVHMDRGYIQYGLGFNKRFGDRFNGFLQAVIRNVGRTGIGLQAGFQWQLGKGGAGEIKGQTPELKGSKIVLNGQKIQ